MERADEIIQQVDQEYARNNRSLADKVRDRMTDAFRDRNEDGMISVPWFKSKAGQEPTWYVLEIDNPDGPGKLYMSRAGMEYDDAPIWDTLDKATITFERDAHGFAQWHQPPPPGLRPVPLEEARNREDLQTVINLANEIEDRTPAEREAIQRVTQSLDWASDRSLNQSQDRGRGR
jgi:hypothetical protein